MNKVDSRPTGFARPGAGQFGQKELRPAATRSFDNRSTAEKAVSLWKKMEDERAMRSQKIVTDMAKDFFAPTPSKPEISKQVGTITPPSKIQDLRDKILAAKEDPITTVNSSPEEFDDLPEVGGLLNVSA